MNIDEALRLLLEYLSPFRDYFIIHQDFIHDIANCLKKELKGSESDFFDQMIAQLDYIKQFGKNVYQVNGNEILRGVGNDSNDCPWNLYSIHMSSKKYNMRFIIKFDEQSTPFLLYAFFERSGKKKTDYTTPIQISKERYLALKRFLESKIKEDTL